MERGIVDRASVHYPLALREIARPPERLYCIGDLSLLEQRAAAVVGSRKYTLYGKMTAGMIGRELAAAGIPVVSGLAAGIDTFAHEGVLERNGRGIAVLGTGFDRLYPSRNAGLMKRLVEAGGLIVSEYPPEHPGAKYTFPARNRIISGLAECVVVVEAGVRSGSLITAEHAAEQGRSLYAVPGNINSQFSLGTNLLIRDGAKPLVVLADLIEELDAKIPASEEAGCELGAEERCLCEYIARSEGCSVDALAEWSGKPIRAVNALLTVLEIKGIVTTQGGRLFLIR